MRNYRASSKERLTRSGRPTIGYFNTELLLEWASIPWRGLADAAKENDVNLVSFIGGAVSTPKWKNDYSEQGNTVYDLARGGRLDGVIVWKGHINENVGEEEFLRFCGQYGVPAVTMEGDISGYPCVTIDNDSGFQHAVDHLIDVHGLKKVGFAGLIETHAGFRQRYAAYRKSMEKHSLSPEPAMVKEFFPPDEIVNGDPVDAAMEKWLDGALRSGMQAVIGVCDPVAMQMVRILERMGRRVPKDVSVVGFDGFSDSRVMTPSLTTIDPSWYEFGRLAMETMLSVLSGETVPEKTLVPYRIVIGQTCGCLETNIQFTLERRRGRGSRESTARKIVAVSGSDGLPGMQEKVEGILGDFEAEMRKKDSAGFIRELEVLLRGIVASGRDVIPWQDAITVLHDWASGALLGRRALKRVDLLCAQSRILVGNTAARALASQRIASEAQLRRERRLGDNLLSTFKTDELMELLSGGLPGLGITECYCALFEKPAAYRYPEPASEWSNLVLAFDARGKMPADGKRFPSRGLLPADMILEDRAHNLVVHALHFRESQIGFIIFEAQTKTGMLFDFLRTLIGSSLKGALLVQHINRHSETLESGIEDIAGSITEMTRNIDGITGSIMRQASAVEEGASTIEEMKQNIGHIAQMSGNSSDISGRLSGVASEGVDSIKRIIAAIQEIQGESKNIFDLLGFIKRIANQTTLLAFNAAIEAAHAGDSGRGFSIVAEEIRSLADNTNTNIKGIEKAARALLARINETAVISGRTGTGLENIISQTRMNEDLAKQLNLAMQEQEKGAGEILKATQELVNITSEIKSSMMEQATATEEFGRTLLKLRSLTRDTVTG